MMNVELRNLLITDFPVVNALKRLQAFVGGFVAEIGGVGADEDDEGIKIPLNIKTL